MYKINDLNAKEVLSATLCLSEAKRLVSQLDSWHSVSIYVVLDAESSLHKRAMLRNVTILLIEAHLYNRVGRKPKLSTFKMHKVWKIVGHKDAYYEICADTDYFFSCFREANIKKKRLNNHIELIGSQNFLHY